MERQKRPRDKKIRVNITISESVYNEYGLYIDNLSAFINKTLKNYISRAKELENSQKATNEVGTDNNLLCYKSKKSSYANQLNTRANEDSQPLNDEFKWW